MNEQEEKQEKQETSENSNEGNQQESSQLIDDANLAAKRLEEANKTKKELLEREERLLAERKLGGKSDLGETQEKKEETDSEYRQKIEREMREGKYNDRDEE